jgi:hypothetical protein
MVETRAPDDARAGAERDDPPLRPDDRVEERAELPVGRGAAVRDRGRHREERIASATA